jgi:hypothetical protein
MLTKEQYATLRAPVPSDDNARTINPPTLEYNDPPQAAAAIKNLLVEMSHDARQRNLSSNQIDEYLAAVVAKNFSIDDINGTGTFSSALSKYFNADVLQRASEISITADQNRNRH